MIDIMKKYIILTLFMAISCMVFAQHNQQPKMEATYYGNKYKTVRHTANGEVFDKNAMTCAAPKRFPFGAKLKVTNLNNGKSVIVTVNDRGRNDLHNRVIDLTYGAFGKIAKHSTGRLRNIKVEVVK